MSLQFSQSASEQRILVLKNTGSVLAPPFGILQVFGMLFSESAGRWTVQVGRPTEDNAKLFVINGPTELDIEQEGLGSWDWPGWVLFDEADGVPALGEVWGVQKDTFKAKKDKRGLIIVPAEFEDETQVEDLTFAMLEYCRP